MFSLENDMQAFVSFIYPEIAMEAEQPVQFGDEDQLPGYSINYLDNGLLIVQNANYYYFLFNPVKMKRLDEIVFQGYEPVPANQIYKNVEEDNMLCSRIVYFDRISNNLLAARTDERSGEQLTTLLRQDFVAGYTK